ncbi:MAG TPA: family 1 glycosylhydrolase [Polyangiaceae bacterium]|nr:family 1 glycosylhydrolase [Polyangiaceae bacterium]
MEKRRPRRPTGPSSIELWGGVECTVNRVGDAYFDQLARSGHDRRESDLGLFAGLGLSALRYPVLWERVAPRGPRSADWSWPDRRLALLRELGVEPVVGLVHHGSGPPGTSLVDPTFADGLASYARAVAERYPWVGAYTPVNEPLTTARFSGLYGHWYPHGRDDRTFLRALVNQCRATALAMRAVRAVNPSARLVQTEDLGFTRSTPGVAYQADFENERRFLSLDLLAGRVGPGHPLYRYLLGAGVAPAELGWFAEHPCPPDLVGVNYYVTSERFLDERLGLYPPELHGGNGRHRYADVEAVRVCASGLLGPARMLADAFARCRAPVAITEAHLGCTPDERARWLVYVARQARAARAGGVDVRAVTAWALLGSYDWNSLVTRDAGHYEPGVFEVAGDEVRPTPVAEVLRSLAAGREPEHPALAEPGWWQQPGRLLYEPFGHAPPRPATRDLCAEAAE